MSEARERTERPGARSLRAGWLVLAAVAGLALLSGGCKDSPAPGPGPGPMPPGPAEARPPWVDAVSHPRFPDSRYLLAVGSASPGDSDTDSRTAADTDARASLVRIIQSKVATDQVAAKAMDIVVDALGKASGAESTEYQELTHIYSEGFLFGSKVVERYVARSSGTHYSLAVLERSVAAREFAVKIQDRLSQAEDRTAALAGRTSRVGALAPLVDACRLYRDAAVLRSTHRVLVGKDVDPERDLLSKVTGDLKRLLEDLRLEVVSGQGQSGSPGAALPEPVVVRVTLQEAGGARPVPSVRLTLAPQHPEEITLSARTLETDESGRAAFRVPLVRATGSPTEAIRVAVDVPDVAERLPDRSLAVSFSIPTRETLKILVLTEEANLGRAIRPPILAVSLQDALRKDGYPIVNPALVVTGGNAARLRTAEPETLRRTLGDRVDVVLRGRAWTEEAGQILGMPGARSHAEIEGIYLRSGQTVVSVEKSAAEAHANRETAGRRALRGVADDVTPEVRSALKRILAGTR